MVKDGRGMAKFYVELPPEAKEMYDGLHAIIKMCRWTYEKAIEEGFTTSQAMELSNTYMRSIMSLGSKK